MFLEMHDLWDYICNTPPLPASSSTTNPVISRAPKGEKDKQKEAPGEDLAPPPPTSDELIATALRINITKLHSKQAKARGFILAMLTLSVQVSLQATCDPQEVLAFLHTKYLPRNQM
jgi:hypothetical protein